MKTFPLSGTVWHVQCGLKTWPAESPAVFYLSIPQALGGDVGPMSMCGTPGYLFPACELGKRYTWGAYLSQSQATVGSTIDMMGV